MVTKTEHVRNELVSTNGDLVIAKIDHVKALDITKLVGDITESQKQSIEIALEKQVEALKDKGEAEGILDIETQLVVEPQRFTHVGKIHSEIRNDSR